MWDNLYSMRTTVCNTKTIPFWPICNCQAIKCEYFQATNWQKDVYFIYWNFLPEIQIEWFAFRGWLVNSRGGFGSLSSLISFFFFFELPADKSGNDLWHFTILQAQGPCIICRPTKRPLRTILWMHSNEQWQDTRLAFRCAVLWGPLVPPAFDVHSKGTSRIYLLKMLLRFWHIYPAISSCNSHAQPDRKLTRNSGIYCQ